MAFSLKFVLGKGPVCELNPHALIYPAHRDAECNRLI